MVPPQAPLEYPQRPLKASSRSCQISLILKEPPEIAHGNRDPRVVRPVSRLTNL